MGMPVDAAADPKPVGQGPSIPIFRSWTHQREESPFVGTGQLWTIRKVREHPEVMMKVFHTAVLTLLLLPNLLLGNDHSERLEKCTSVLQKALNLADGIPQELLDKAECMVVIPSTKKFALGFGGNYGRGAMVCRTHKDYQGPWGTPAMYRLEGGSIGFQIGGSATDYILLVMNSAGAESLLDSKVKLGADASAAAGPKGRTGEASTDAYMRAEILTYSVSRGLFAGVSLSGSTLRSDKGANKGVYGKQYTAKGIILNGKAQPTKEGRDLIAVLQKKSPKNLSKPTQ